MLDFLKGGGIIGFFHALNYRFYIGLIKPF